uniref:Uncharacterized protein n=1 Tax=Oncorhynchus tshawytscha TaxID=74940 RepID=A0A8C8GIS0_ONCTS
MSLYLAVLVLCMSAVYAAPMFDSQLEGHWHLWKNWHSKSYHEREEGWRRMMHNLDHSMGKHSYCLGMNHFGDMDDLCHYRPEFSAVNETGFVDIPNGKEHTLMMAVVSVGPVSVAIDVSHESFQFYQSGIYYEECSSEELDHEVLVVGYGFEGEDVDGKKFWIVKNRYMIKWGDKSYIYMAKDRKNHCGIATAASYPLV